MGDTREQEQQEQIKIQKQLIEDLQKELREGRGQVELDMIQRELDILHDPYDVNNPLSITGEIESNEEYPHGAILGWKSPTLRSTRGMRGWKFFQWGDVYTGKDGKGLEKYIPNPPERFTQSEKLDSLVRRGDLALARIDKKLLQTRRLRAELESARQVGALSSNQKKILAKGVVMSGPGLREDKEPFVGTGRAPDSPGFDKKTGTGTDRLQLTKDHKE